MREAAYMELISSFCDLLASRPNDVQIIFRVSRAIGRPDNIDLTVADADYGAFIGRGAEHIRCLQRLFKAVADKFRTPLAIAIREPNTREVEPGVARPECDVLTDVADWVHLLLTEIDAEAEVEEIPAATANGEDILLVRSSRLGDLGGPLRTLVWAIGAGYGRRIKTEFGEVP